MVISHYWYRAISFTIFNVFKEYNERTNQLADFQRKVEELKDQKESLENALQQEHNSGPPTNSGPTLQPPTSKKKSKSTSKSDFTPEVYIHQDYYSKTKALIR